MMFIKLTWLNYGTIKGVLGWHEYAKFYVNVDKIARFGRLLDEYTSIRVGDINYEVKETPEEILDMINGSKIPRMPKEDLKELL